MNRLELTPAEATGKTPYKKIVWDEPLADRLPVDLYIQSQPRRPERMVLDLDATDDPVHGRQEGRFFHGYYGPYRYLPLYIFCGRHLLGAPFPPSNIDAAAGTVEWIEPMVKQWRLPWPDVEIVLRADSGFGRDSIMKWCENNRVDYVFGLARNVKLRRIIGRQRRQAKQEHERTRQAARVFAEFDYRTQKTWSRARRVMGKAEYLDKGENPRFVVTALSAQRLEARFLYEGFYGQRGDRENRIKERQLALFADRTSPAYPRSNQIRLYFSSIAYCVWEALRRLGLRGSETAKAQCQTIRSRLLKIGGAGARVGAAGLVIDGQRASGGATVFAAVYRNLLGVEPRRV